MSASHRAVLELVLRGRISPAEAERLFVVLGGQRELSLVLSGALAAPFLAALAGVLGPLVHALVALPCHVGLLRAAQPLLNLISGGMS